MRRPARVAGGAEGSAQGSAAVRGWSLERVLTALVLLPIVAAIVRAIAEGWIPMGENAIFPLRARDVLTADHPWLGTFSSASLTSDTIVNHPGPLLFDLLALPVRLLGPAVGTVVGVGMINLVAASVALRAACVSGGRRWFVAVAIAAVALEWTLGSSLLIDPWNPHVLVLPWFALLVSAIAVVSGWRAGLTWVVVLGSLAVQTHVSYALQVPLVIVAALGLGAGAARARAGDGWDVREAARRWRRPAIVATGWGVVLWAQPLWQQVAGPGPGNLTALLRSAREEQARAGWGVALRLVGRVVALPPWWSRDSFTDSLRDLPLRGPDGAPLPLPSWVPSLGVAVAGLALVAALLVAVGVAGWRARRRSVVAPVAVAGVALVVGAWAASSIPAGGYGVAPHQLRWLWPAAVLWMAAVGHGAVALIGERSAGARRDGGGVAAEAVAARRGARPGIAVASGVVVLVAVHACVGYHQPVGVARAPGSPASVEDLVDQVAHSRFPPVVLDNSGMWIGEPYTGPLLERVVRDGVGRVTVDETQAAQVGRRRLVTDEVAARLQLRWGAAALVCPADGGQRIALTTPAPADVVAAVVDGAAQAERVLGTIGLVADAASLAEVPDVAAAIGDPVAAQQVVLSGRLAEVLATTSLGTWVTEEDRAVVDTFEAVRASVGIDTVAAFVDPRTPGVAWAAGDPLAAQVVPGRTDVACPLPG